MKRLVLLLVGLASFCLLGGQRVAADPVEYHLFKVSASLPVTRVEVGQSVDKLSTKTLTGKELVNLALGRSLTTRVDPKTEVLAVQATFETPSSAPLAKLVVLNTVNQTRVATIATLSSLDYEVAYLARSGSGRGIAAGQFLLTTLGDPAKNRLEASTFHLAGAVNGPRVDGRDLSKLAPAGVITLTGKIRFVFTDAKNVTTDFTGFVTGGTIRGAGRRIGVLVE